MNFALGLFVLSLLGAEAPAGSEPCDEVVHKVTALTVDDSPRVSDGSAIAYDVRVIKIHGLEWRGAFFSQLQPVTSQMGGTVWTASRETAERLAELDPICKADCESNKAPIGMTAASHRLPGPPQRSRQPQGRLGTRAARGWTVRSCDPGCLHAPI